MKIAFVCQFYIPAVGGVKQVVQELAVRYVKKGHEVHVFASDSDKFGRIKKKYEIIDGVHVHRCRYWFKVANFAYIWPSVFFKLLRYDFDIIHSHVFGHVHTFLAALAAKIKRVPHIHTTHCCWTDAFRSLAGRVLLKLTYPTFGRLSLMWADKVIAITPWEDKYIEKYGGKGKIVHIPNGVDSLFFKKTKGTFKKELDITGKLVLFVGSLEAVKAPHNFISAAKRILANRSDIHFVVIGPDRGMRTKISKMSKGNKNIHILGPVYDRQKISCIYGSSDIFVSTSYKEGFPLAMLEAMAAGLPVVATAVNGVPDLIKKENGILVKYGDIKGIADAIISIFNDKLKMLSMGQANKSKALNYRWSTIADKTLKLYHSVLRVK